MSDTEVTLQVHLSGIPVMDIKVLGHNWKKTRNRFIESAVNKYSVVGCFLFVSTQCQK